MRQAFVAYVAGYRRPIAELLRPNQKPIGDLYASHFVGMTTLHVTLNDLELARRRLFDWVEKALTDNERHFLLSVKHGDPDWSLLPFEGLEKWPAIQWKVQNVREMGARKHRAALTHLQRLIGD